MPKTELIEKQAVLDLFHKRQPYLATRVVEFGNALKELPTVEAEPEHGHWVINGEWCTCSECKQSLHYERSKGKSNLINALSMAVNFCPNCGAKMDGEVERETD